MLKQRILTALILIPVMLAALFYFPPPWFFFFTAIITLGAAWEWTNLMGLSNKIWRFAYLVILCGLFFMILFIPIPLVVLIATIWWLVGFVLVILYPRGSRYWGNSIFLRGIMGCLVLVPCWAAINYIRNLGNGIYTLLFLFVLIWGADIVAYFVGKKWGKNKLAPMVSPGKSIQGFVAALLFSVIMTIAMLIATDVPRAIWWPVLALSFATVLFSVGGDLFESMLKRQVNIKDSGWLLPGHGGLLDRIDSLTAAAPIYALGITILMMFVFPA